jgi:galactonate dehydratase
MRLSDLETFVVGNPPPRKGGRYFLFVKLTTACGIVGYGEVYAASFSPRVVGHDRGRLRPPFRGRRPAPRRAPVPRHARPGLFAPPRPVADRRALGLETACWDIIGKSAGKPVYDLLGGRCRERLRSYTYLYPDGDDAHAAAERPDRL